MQMLWGFLNPGGQEQTSARLTLDRMGAQFESNRSVLVDPHASMGVAGPPPHHIYRRGSLVVAIAGRPYWHSQPPTGDANLAKDFTFAYQSKGSAAIEDLGGSFALALYDETKQRGLLAVDRIGIEQLYYTQTKEGLVFARVPRALLAHPEVDASIALQGIFNYLHFHVVPSPDTVWENLKQLPPGHLLEFHNKTACVKRYWAIRFKEHERESFRSLQDEFMSVLHRAVGRACTNRGVGAFLSGGTDSSSVTGLLTNVLGEPVHTYSIGFAAAGYDETMYSKITSKHFNTIHREYYVTPEDVVNAVPKVAAFYDQPYGNASAVPTFYCALLAKEDGIEHMLGGDGGDELFGGNERYARQWLLSLYPRIPAPFREMLVEPLVFKVPYGDRIMPLQKVKSYIEQARPSPPGQRRTYNLLQHAGYHKVLTADFLDEVDTHQPFDLLNDVRASMHAESFINRMLGVDIKFTLADNDLPKVTQMCALAGVEAHFPLLDDEVVEFSTKLPPRMKLRATQLRYFFKRAMADYLPREVLTKKKHGFGLPFGVWLRTDPGLNALAHDSLTSLKSRRIIRPEFIDELTNTKLEINAPHYGAFVWLFIMLEHWFSANEVRPSVKLAG